MSDPRTTDPWAKPMDEWGIEDVERAIDMEMKPAMTNDPQRPLSRTTVELLEAARRVIEVAKRYRDWMFGAAITPQDKNELIEAVDAYEKTEATDREHIPDA
jgi:hypothetical protein